MLFITRSWLSCIQLVFNGWLKNILIHIPVNQVLTLTWSQRSRWHQPMPQHLVDLYPTWSRHMHEPILLVLQKGSHLHHKGGWTQYGLLNPVWIKKFNHPLFEPIYRVAQLIGLTQCTQFKNWGTQLSNTGTAFNNPTIIQSSIIKSINDYNIQRWIVKSIIDIITQHGLYNW